jgi:hypothetical protein
MLAILRDALPMCDGVLQIIAEYCKGEICDAMGPDSIPGYYYEGKFYTTKTYVLGVGLLNNVYCETVLKPYGYHDSAVLIRDLHSEIEYTSLMVPYSFVYKIIFLNNFMFIHGWGETAVYKVASDFSTQITAQKKSHEALLYVDDQYVIMRSPGSVIIYNWQLQEIKKIPISQWAYFMCSPSEIYNFTYQLFAKLDMQSLTITEI